MKAELTKAEEQVMQILWELNEAFVKDIIAKLPEPKPAYNTISTIVRILERKKLVAHNSFGKTHQYYPLISRDEYLRGHFGRVVRGYFSNSYKQLVSFFTTNNSMSIEEMEELRTMIEEQIEKKRGGKQ